MLYAVNIADATEVDNLRRELLLVPVLERGHVVEAEPGYVDGTAVVFRADIPQLDILSAISVLQGRLPNQRPLRCYESQSGKSWRRIKLAGKTFKQLQALAQ